MEASDSEDELMVLTSIFNCITTESIVRNHLIDDQDDDERERSTLNRSVAKVGPGRGNCVLGVKALYERRKGVVDMFYKSFKEAHDLETWLAL